MAGRGIADSLPITADRVWAWSALAVSAVSEWLLALVSEARYSAGDRRAALVFDARGSATDARAYFLFCGKKKVAKEKATPGYAVGCADSPALLEGPGGCATRRCAAQTVLADCPRPFSVARRSTWGPRKASLLNGQGLNRVWFRSARFAGPLGRRRATQALADKGRALSEGQSPELRSPRQRRVAQGTRVAGADLGVAFFLATFSWPRKKKYARRSAAEPSGSASKHARASGAETGASATKATRTSTDQAPPKTITNSSQSQRPLLTP